MTLLQIDQRLSLFKEYMKYRLQQPMGVNILWDISLIQFNMTAEMIMRTLNETGFLFINSEENVPSVTGTMSFDEWLKVNNHKHLVLSEPICADY